MITGRTYLLEARLRDRGYTLADIEQCIISRQGDTITVDETHPAYPRGRNPDYKPERLAPQPRRGPGTELTKLLATFGITYTPDCECRSMAARMDAWGCDECSKPERIDEVLGVMRAEAARRGLPFLDAAGRVLIRRAIANARKEARAAPRSPLSAER